MNPDLLLLLVSVAGGAVALPGLAGQVFTYLWLGFFPGLALVNLLMPDESRGLRYTLAIALSPVLVTVLAWGLLRCGLSFTGAATALAAAGWLALLFAARPRPERMVGENPNQVPRGALLWSIGLGLMLVLVPVVNPYLFIRGDSWIHGGIVMELIERGFPPQDARMAGLQLNYVWFFNLFIALLHALQGQDIFRFMTLFNGANGFATAMLTALIARRLWGGERAPLAAVVVLTLGLNAGAFVLWPLNLVKALTGKVTGLSEMVRLWNGIEWNTARVIYSLSAPFAEMVSFLDKLLVGTALNFAYLQMATWLWAMLAWLDERRRNRLLVIMASGAGMMLFHSVVGLSALPLGLVVLGLAWWMRPRWHWLPDRGALVAAALATGLGLVLTLPYLRSITAGWAPQRAGFRFEFVQFNRAMPWTLVTSCAFVLVWMVAPLRSSWRERRPLPLMLAAWAVLMAGFSFVVHLPQHNAVKFVYECFTACAILAAPRAAEIAANLRARPRLSGAVLVMLWIVPTLLTLRGYLVDATGRTREELRPIPGEQDLYRWLRQETPRDAVVVDRGFRDLVAVNAARRLYLGTDQPPELAAFPAPEMARRQATMRDLYGPLATPESTVARLLELGPPVYVLYRPGDSLAIPEPWKKLEASSPHARLVYDFSRFHVVRIGAGGPS